MRKRITNIVCSARIDPSVQKKTGSISITTLGGIKQRLASTLYWRTIKQLKLPQNVSVILQIQESAWRDSERLKTERTNKVSQKGESGESEIPTTHNILRFFVGAEFQKQAHTFCAIVCSSIEQRRHSALRFS
jgi:hypothetical protein